MGFVDSMTYVMGIALIVMMASFVFKENVFYRVCERTFVAISITWMMTAGVILIKDYIANIFTKGGLAYISLIWIPLGFMILFQVSKGKLFYLSRLPISIFMGSQMGLILRGRVHTGILQSIVGVIKPITLVNVMFIVLSATAVFYFTYSIEHKGPLQTISKLGQYSVMIYMGSIFGTLTIKRLSYLGNAFFWILDALEIMGIYSP